MNTQKWLLAFGLSIVVITFSSCPSPPLPDLVQLELIYQGQIYNANAVYLIPCSSGEGLTLKDATFWNNLNKCGKFKTFFECECHGGVRICRPVGVAEEFGIDDCIDLPKPVILTHNDPRIITIEELHEMIDQDSVQ